MGTWRWFSIEYCEATSSCVVVDAWLQLFVCVSAVFFLLLLSLGCCLGSTIGLRSRVHQLPLLSLFFGGRSTNSKTAPMPLAVIQQDAGKAHITSHKTSLKQASEFMRQTQRVSRTDFATTDKDARTATAITSRRSLSFIGRIGDSFSMRRSSKLQQDTAADRRRASHDVAAAEAFGRDTKSPLRKLSSPLPMPSSTSRRGSAVTSLDTAVGDHDDGPVGDDVTRRPSKTESTAGRIEHSASFRQRLTTVFYPNFIRAIQQQRPTSPTTNLIAPTTEHRKKTPLARSASTFEVPSYRKRQKLAALPLAHRQNKERRGSVELRDKRRLSVGRGAQIRFDVSDGNEASVYEVKLKEITLVKRLAFGPLSEVYAAIWRDTKVGVKLLMPREGVTDKLEEAVKNFRREIWVTNALKHANIVKLIGASLTPTCYVLVMEYMSNGSLYEYLRDEANFFPHQMVLTSALDIADGMRHIHASGVLQRDLKSKNCLVSENLVVKVADFGLSRFARRSTPDEQYTFVGTPFWAAPEVIRHEPYDEKADVYSYAIVLWELVERKDPYEQLNAFQVPLQVANDGLRPEAFVRTAPLGLEQLMKQCWDADPDQRPSFDDIAETLQKWLTPANMDDDENGDQVLDSSGGGEDLSAHVQRECGCANERVLNRFASSHDANAKAIPIVLTRGKTDGTLVVSSLHQRRGSAIALQGARGPMLPRPHSARSLSPASQ